MRPARSLESSWSLFEERRAVSIQLSPRRVRAGLVALIAVFLAVVGVEALGVSLPILRSGLAFVVLSFVPGYLLLRIFGLTPESTSETVVYVIGLSLVSLMVAGTALNFILQPIVARPLTEGPIVLGISTVLLGLIAFYSWQGDDELELTLDVAELSSPLVLGLALFPFLGVYGALALTRFGTNLLLLILYSLLALLPILVFRDRIPARFFPYVIWIASISLLLQNTLTGHFLAWGDQPKEAALALSVMRTGYWNPALAPAFGNKFTMLRIVILHPIYALFADLQLVWIFKLVHPLLFSVTPIALYQAYRRYVDDRAAFISAFLFISLFPFFIVLSRNTRTATAILFLALIALLVADRTLPLFQRKILAILFAAGIVVSHYGVSYMVLFGLAAVLPLLWILDSITGRETETVTSWSFVLLYITVNFAWYIFASPRSKAFNLLLGFGQSFITKLKEQFLVSPGSTSATTRYISENFSSSIIDILKFYNIIIGAFIGVGLLLTFWRLFRDSERVGFDNEYLAYSAVFLAMFGVTFLPVERFNTARTYPTTLLFFAPFFVIGVRELFGRITSRSPVDVRFPFKRVAAGVVIVYFVLNVGLLSAVVVNQYSPNALVEKDRIMDDGHPTEKTYFYKQYPTIYGVESTRWMRTSAANNSTLYLGGWPGNFRGDVGHTPLEPRENRNPVFRGQRITRDLLSAPGQLDSGYVYLNAYGWIGNIIRLRTGHFGFASVYTREVQSNWRDKNRVYDNGGSVVYY